MAKKAKKVAPKKAAKPKTPKTETSKASTPALAQADGFKYDILDEGDMPEAMRMSRSVASPYPFAAMEVGKGFVVAHDIDPDLYASETEAETAKREALRTIANRLSGAVRRFTKKNDGFKFKVYTAANGVGVKRVA